jgi:DeoR family transcriptional regulator of aga operon
MKTMTERHSYILAQLRKVGYVRVVDLAEELGVSTATIRKDLTILENKNLLHRTHGSASPLRSNVIDLPVQEKSGLNSDKKEAIARAANDLIQEGDSILLTSGSTIETFAKVLTAKGTLNVVTPSIRVGIYLSEKEGLNIMMLGGRLIVKSLSVRDSYTEEGLKYVRCNKAFFSCDGFDFDGGVTTAFVAEAKVTDSMLNVATEVILLADSTKLGKSGFGKICDMTKVDTLITDAGIPQSIKRRFEEEGVKVIVAK